MPTPSSMARPSRLPTWIGLVGGAVLGVVVWLLFFPWGIVLSPRGRSLSHLIWVFTLASLGWNVLISGIFGVLAARWSWSWAQRPAHPLLAWCESWAPLRGRWLLIVAGVVRAASLWVGLWAALFVLFYLPQLLRMFENVPLEANVPVVIAIVAGGASALGYLVSRIADHRTKRSGSSAVPGQPDPASENRSGNPCGSE